MKAPLISTVSICWTLQGTNYDDFFTGFWFEMLGDHYQALELIYVDNK